MKTLKGFRSRAKIGWNKHGQLILAVTSGVAAITATVLAFRAGEKAVEIKETRRDRLEDATIQLQNGEISQQDFEKEQRDANIEAVKGFFVYCGPAVAFVTVSIVSTAFGYKISIGKQAAALAALKIADSKRGELEAKAKEVIGEKKFEQIKDGILSDKVNSQTIPEDVHATEDEYEYDGDNNLIKKAYDQPCLLVCDGSMFMGNPLKIKRAILNASQRCSVENYVTINELKDELKEAKCSGTQLRHTMNNEYLGFITDDLNRGVIDYKIRPIQSDDLGGCQVLAIEFLKEPAPITWNR